MIDVPLMNMVIRNAIETCCTQNNWTTAQYASKVGVSLVKIYAIRRGVIMINALTVEELNTLIQYHNINIMI